LDYRKAGVDIDATSAVLRSMKERIRSTFGGRVIGDVGHFGGLYALPGDEKRALVASCDGVGTKILLYSEAGRHEGVGEDLVSHCVNDIAVLGARPLFFLDYIAGSRLPADVLEPLLRGFTDACLSRNIALLGGETAEMPGVYAPGAYDVVGFIAGIVERADIVDGSSIESGDRLIGLPSSGLHTNGYSLARKALLEMAGLSLDDRPEGLGESVGEALLRPHLCYLRPISRLTSEGVARGFAHITGGGLEDNVPRILPDGRGARVRKGRWPVPPIFRLIQERGSVDEDEMFRVFNMGIGLVAVVAARDEERAIELCREEGTVALSIGEIVPGEREVRIAE